MKKLIPAVLCAFLVCFLLVLSAELSGAGAERSTLHFGDCPAPVPAWEQPAEPEVRPPENILIQAPTAQKKDKKQGQTAKFPKDILQGNLLQSLLVPVHDDDPPNDELQRYVHSQAKVSGDTIRITAIREENGYLSAQLRSSISFLYGDFTFRVKTMTGDGLFPAIWMLPASGEKLPEVDIYEALGNSPQYVFGVMHYLENGNQTRSSFVKNNQTEYHTIRLHWTEHFLTWYVDGELAHSILDHVPREPMYLLINLAIGGNWPGDPTEDTEFPAVFESQVLDFQPESIFIR